MKILIFTTGGTIDKVYFDAKSIYQVGPPSIAKILGELSLQIDYSIKSLFKKDSLEINDLDRKKILSAIKKTKEKKIIITHGTDSMVKTAQYLSTVKDKTIVLTGALEPALFKTSDAIFNIGCAISAAQTLLEGVYIAMNGKIFKYDQVIKNIKKDIFETIK